MSVLEVKDGAIVLYFNCVTGVVNSLFDSPINDSAGNEEIEFFDMRGRLAGCRRVHKQPERTFEFALVVAFAVEHGPNRPGPVGRRSHEAANVGGIAPEIRAAGEVLAVAQCIRQKNPIHSAGRGSADDVENDFGIGQFLDEALNAVALDGMIKLL